LPRAAPIVRKRDLRSAIEAVVGAGAQITQIEVAPDGRILISVGNCEPAGATHEAKLLEAINARAKRAQVRDGKV